MEGIQGLGQQVFLPVSTTPKNETSSTSRPATDTFEKALVETASAETVKPLTLDIIRDLGSRYDSTDMTRNQFNSLLKELRDAGAITQKAFSDGYTGAATQEDSLWPMPAGEETADFRNILFHRSWECARSSDPNGAALAESYEQIKHVINRLVIDYDHYCETPEERAAKIVKKNYRSPEELGIPDLTGMSDQQKLNVLVKLHRATDYSGLDDVAKYKLIQDRFEAVFPNQILYSTYGYGGRLDKSSPWDGSNGGTTMEDRIRGQFDVQLEEAGLIGASPALHAQAYYYSQGASPTEEVRQAIVSARHNNGATAADQISILAELRMGQGNYNADGFHSRGVIRSDLLSKVGPDTPPLWDSLDELFADSMECDEVLDKILLGKMKDKLGIEAKPLYPAGRNAALIDTYMAHRSEIGPDKLYHIVNERLQAELEDDPYWFLRDKYDTTARFAERTTADLSELLEKILQEEAKKMEDELEKILE